MKMNSATTVAVLAVISAAILIILVAGGGTLLYSAEGNVATPDQADASTISVMTTEEAETILPLMGNIIGLSYDAMFQMYLGDPEYAARYLAAYDTTVGLFSTNLGKVKLTQTDINKYRKESSALGTSLRIILEDRIRLDEIDDLKREYALQGNSAGLYQLSAESALIYNELALTAQNYVGSAEVMEEIALVYGLDPTQLQATIPLLTKLITAATSGKITVTTDAAGNLIITEAPGISTDTSGSITLSVTPITARYGDTLTVSGVARNTKPTLSIYWDTSLWGTASVDTANHYVQKLTVGQISKGTHAVTVQSDGISSKPVYITILSRPSVVTITKAEQTSGELHRRLTLYGLLRTEGDRPVIGAPVTVFSEDHINIGTGITNANGVWNVSAELIDGGYVFYAVFNDASFPLDESMSDEYPVSILDPTIFYILLAVAGGVLLVLVVRFAIKRKPKAAPGRASASLLGNKAKVPSGIKTIIQRIFKKEDRDPDPLRRIYRKTAGFLAGNLAIENVSALTPRELLAAVPSPKAEIQAFITMYEYLHYANVSAGPDQIKHLEDLAKQIIEGTYDT
ncbi:MAG TPA: hypothetical protein O0X66_01650 [Methanocorpusculum sp.]|nr:hypothetical protein [Methanocorpusculum sp.]